MADGGGGEGDKGEDKKPGFDKLERLSRRIDSRQADAYAAKRKNDPRQDKKGLFEGLLRLRKKIARDKFDEEDEDENEGGILLKPDPFLEIESRREDDRRQTLEDIRARDQLVRQNAAARIREYAAEAGIAERRERMAMAERFAELSLTHTDALRETLRESLARDEAAKLREVSGGKNLAKALRGMKRVKAMVGSRALEKMNAQEVAKAGEKDAKEREIAELLLEKTGRLRELDKKDLAEKEAKIREARNLLRQKTAEGRTKERG